MTIALTIGNGESRSTVNLPQLALDYDFTVGCNALHRDMTVNHLVCCDKRMVEEAVKSENTKKTKIYTRQDWFRYYYNDTKDERVLPVPFLPYNGELKQDDPVHWGSGPYAVLLSAMLSNTVLMIGFDLYSTNSLVNNIYKNTKNYSSSDKKSVDPSYWIYQTAKVFEHFPDTSFIIFNKDEWVLPEDWKKDNVRLEYFS